MLDASSTLRELYSIYIFLLEFAAYLARGRHRVIMDNLGCVFIMGGIVPPFAVGGKQWGEFVTGGSPNPTLQDRKSTRLNSSHVKSSYAVFCLKKKRNT